MAERPGIILYFDMVAPLKRLGYEDKGKLLEAILEYGQYGVVPELDGVLPFIWDCIQPKLDADAKRYRKTVFQKTYSSYCAKEKKAGRVPMDFDDWCEKEGIDTTEWNRVEPYDAMRYPTEKGNTNTTTKSNKAIDGNPKLMTMREVDGGGKGEEEPTQDKDFETLRREKLAMLTGTR